MCAHCRGDDGTPGLYFADAPSSPRAGRVVEVPPERARRRERPRGRVEYPVLCAARCRREGPRATDRRAWVCPVCEDQARDALYRVADLWPDLEGRLTALRAVWSTERVSSDPEVGISLNQAALDVRTDVEELVAWWCWVVRDERGHVPPVGGVPVLARWLARNHVPWLAAHPDELVAAGFVDDAREFAGRVRGVVFPAGTRVVQVPRRCPVRVGVPDEGGVMPEPYPDGSWPPDVKTVGCPGWLTARIHPDLAQLPDLVCGTDPAHVVAPSVWRKWQHAT